MYRHMLIDAYYYQLYAVKYKFFMHVYINIRIKIVHISKILNGKPVYLRQHLLSLHTWLTLKEYHSQINQTSTLISKPQTSDICIIITFNKNNTSYGSEIFIYAFRRICRPVFGIPLLLLAT